MARRAGFTANKRVIGKMLRTDPGVGAALDDIAGAAADRAGGTVRKYVTDRQVVAVEVGAEEQAIDGAATKAMAEVQGFATRRAWRRAFAAGDEDASERAHATPGGYRSLPEKAN